MYKGLPFNIPLGDSGLRTDDPHRSLAPGELILANNISLEDARLEKAPGSLKYNSTALSAGIVAAFDWWPDTQTQQFIAVTRDGKVWMLPDIRTNTLVTAGGTSPTTLSAQNQTCIVAGGAESQGRNRKLFIMTGQDPIQVISGNSVTRTTISKPAADWTDRNQPSFGIQHHGRLIVWGCPNNPHQAYGSNPDDHEDFQTFGGKALNFVVYPGEYEKLLSGFVYKGRLFWFKFPQGIYYLDDSDPNTSNWGIFKYADAFGAASAFPCAQVLDDLLVANNAGSITSLKAVQYYGGIEMADVLRNTRASKYVRNYMQPSGLLSRQSLYYPEKKLAMFTYQSSSGLLTDRILVLDFNKTESPRVMWYDKDQPNCLGLCKTIVDPVSRPFYGSEDGFIYLMDRVDRNVGGNAYQMEFMTPHMDFHQMSSFNTGYQVSDLGQKNKHFDFLTVEIEQTGKWNLSIDVFIDGAFIETLLVPMATKKGLGEMTLNVDRLYSDAGDKITVPLHGMGKTIAFRCYNNGVNENVKLLGLTAWFRPAGQEQTEDES